MAGEQLSIIIARDTLPTVRVVTKTPQLETGHTLTINSLSDLFKEIVDGVGRDFGAMPWIDLLATERQIAFQQRFGGRHTIVWTRPAMPRKIRVQLDRSDDRPERTIVFPPITWVIQWNMGNVVDAKLYISERCPTSLGDDTGLYAFPYGNVYDKGSICWGDGNMAAGITTRCTTPDDVDRFFFYSAPFNSDLVRDRRLTQDDDDNDIDYDGLGNIENEITFEPVGPRYLLASIVGDLK